MEHGPSRSGSGSWYDLQYFSIVRRSLAWRVFSYSSLLCGLNLSGVTLLRLFRAVRNFPRLTAPYFVWWLGLELLENQYCSRADIALQLSTSVSVLKCSKTGLFGRR